MGSYIHDFHSCFLGYMFGFSQCVVSLPVSHMGLEAGISFSSGAGFHQNGALTQVQLAGWEGAVCIFNTRSDTLKENSCQYATFMSQSQMLDGFGVFCPTLPCTSRKLFRGGAPVGPVLGRSPHV